MTQRRIILVGAGVVVLFAMAALLAASYRRAQRSMTLSVCVDHLFKIADTKKQYAILNDLKPGDEVPQKFIEDWLGKFCTDGTWRSFQCRELTENQWFTIGKVGEPPQCPVHGTYGDVRAQMMEKQK